jgi:O-antigen/teichoic acid export membrane protein
MEVFHLKINMSAKSGIIWARGLLKSEAGLVYTTFGHISESLLGGVFWFVLAALLDVESYGLVNYYIALASIFAVVGALGLNATVTTFMVKGEKEILYEANSLTLIAGLLLGVVLSVFQWSSGFVAAAMLFFAMTRAELLGRKSYREYALLSIGERTVQIILSVILFFQLGILGVLLGYFLGYLIFSYRYLRSISRFTIRINSLREKRNFAFHSYGFNLIRNSTLYFDKILIAPLFGYFALGSYQLGFQFYMLLSVLPLSLYFYLLPEESSGKNKRTVKVLGLVFSVVACGAAFVAMPYVITNFFSTFVDSIQIARIMSLAVIPSTIVAILSASLLGKGRSKIVFVAGLVYLAVLVTGILILGQALGVLGLGITLVLAQISQATCLIVKRNAPKVAKDVEKYF